MPKEFKAREGDHSNDKTQTYLEHCRNGSTSHINGLVKGTHRLQPKYDLPHGYHPSATSGANEIYETLINARRNCALSREKAINKVRFRDVPQNGTVRKGISNTHECYVGGCSGKAGPHPSADENPQ